MKNKSPFISIITVVLNDENKIRLTLESIKNQQFKNFQYIIIDGGSHDKTLEIINEYSDVVDIIISEKDNGIYHAENKGIKLSQGVWIFFLLSGDYFSSDYSLLYAYEFLKDDHISNFIFSKYISNNITYSQQFNYLYLMRKNICQQSIFYKTELLNKYPFNPNMKFSADANFIYQAYSHIIYKCIDIDLIHYDTTGISSQRKYILTIWQERIHALKHSNLPCKYKYPYLTYAYFVYFIRSILGYFSKLKI